MEIRDKSRSVNSVDVVFNFDCIGFTGTPFIDNYPTFAYISRQREDKIPDMIDRSFYAYTSDALSEAEFEERFARFQGKNSNVLVEYVSSDFLKGSTDELAILEHIFVSEGDAAAAPTGALAGGTAREEVDSMDVDAGMLLPKPTRGDAERPPREEGGFNVLVDLCGIFKRSSIHEVRDLVLRHFGADRFHFIYHIDQSDGGDRVLDINSDNDVQFDEEFYKHLCERYGASLRDKIFFFVDNRNVIGKDIPFQLVYQRRFAQPLFTKSVVLAHDVDDFSKIWQAMGRSRTMNETLFTIYKSDIPKVDCADGSRVAVDIKKLPLTRQLYVRNCDCKMAGNLSSIYQTLIALFNLSQDSFYYCDEIINVFLEKMEATISDKVRRHELNLQRQVFGAPVPAGILMHILEEKFRRSSSPVVAAEPLTLSLVQELVHHIVEQKFEQRPPSGDIFDEFIMFLSGEQEGLMEISYTKQQQKQKQKQQNKNQDSDTMEIFNKKNQLEFSEQTDDYFKYTLTPKSDRAKISLNLPVPIPIFKLSYVLDGSRHHINVYPTLQFLYSHHIQPDYITQQVKEVLQGYDDFASFYKRFFAAVEQNDASGAPPSPVLPYCELSGGTLLMYSSRHDFALQTKMQCPASRCKSSSNSTSRCLSTTSARTRNTHSRLSRRGSMSSA